MRFRTMNIEGAADQAVGAAQIPNDTPLKPHWYDLSAIPVEQSL
jgi:hypothetical protein